MFKNLEVFSVKKRNLKYSILSLKNVKDCLVELLGTLGIIKLSFNLVEIFISMLSK
jgi:hypothetical protein